MFPQEPIIYKKPLFSDNRGYFFEMYNYTTLKKEHKITSLFVQDNVSFSKKGVIRGLHFQNPKAQGKLISVLSGKIFDVIIDLRKKSKNFLKKYEFKLDEKENHSLWVPEGFAHGFQALKDKTIILYKCTNIYSPQNEKTIIFNDPDLNINWPLSGFSLSKKDMNGLLVSKLLKSDFF